MKKNNLELVLLAIIILLSYDWYMFIKNFLQYAGIVYWDVGSGGIGWKAYFMVMVTMFSAILFMDKLSKKEHIPKIIKIAVLFGFSGILSTALSGLYSLSRLLLCCITVFFWIAILIIAYFGSLKIKDIKKLLWATVIFLPLFFTAFLKLLLAGTGYMLLLNPVYYIFFMLPFILLIKPGILKNIGILIVFSAIVMSYKRTALFSFALCMIYYFYFGTIIKKEKISKKLISWLFIAIGVLAGIYIYGIAVQNFNLDWSARIASLSTDSGAGRAQLWLNAMDALKKQDIFLWPFGNGYLATAVSFGWAHNDFLEVLYDYGVIGLFLYVWFIVLLIKYSFKIKKADYEYGVVFQTSIVLFLSTSMVSQLVILPYWFLYLPLFWGIVIADYERKKVNTEDARINKARNDIQADIKQI